MNRLKYIPVHNYQTKASLKWCYRGPIILKHSDLSLIAAKHAIRMFIMINVILFIFFYFFRKAFPYTCLQISKQNTNKNAWPNWMFSKTNGLLK